LRFPITFLVASEANVPDRESGVKPHRRSYWKTILLASVGSALVGSLALWCVRQGSGAWLAAGATAGAIAVIGFAVVLGGLVVLYLDTHEGRGRPAPDAGRSPRSRLEAGPPTRSFWEPRGLGPPRAGELVEVRSEAEILATLDERGMVEALPFMPEMLRYGGRRFRVFRRVDKINDMILKTGLRRMKHAATLEGVRCDGSAHGGCEAGCQILWKDVWLKRVEGDVTRTAPAPAPGDARGRRVLDAAVRPADAGDGAAEDVYACQITELRRATSGLKRWDVGQDVRPLLSGNVRPGDYLVAVFVRLFNVVQRWRGGAGYPEMDAGRLERTPEAVLNLQPGDLVRVKSREEIAATLDVNGRNRGMRFDREMIRFCGRKFRVLRRVSRIIDERTGKMLTLRNSCIVLDGVTATGEFLRFCPQNEYIFWREIWLERVPEPPAS
jgi:hypothetical protein